MTVILGSRAKKKKEENSDCLSLLLGVKAAREGEAKQGPAVTLR